MDQQSSGERPRKVTIEAGAASTPLPELPLNIVVVAELQPRPPFAASAAGAARRVRVDKDAFDAAMAAFDLGVVVEVPDRLSGGTGSVTVRLELASLQAFRPGAVAARVPACRDLLEVRKALLDLAGGRTRLEAVRELLGSLEGGSALVRRIRDALEAPAGGATEAPAGAPAPPAAADDPLDAVFRMVETQGGPDARGGEGAPEGRLDGLLRRLAGSAGRERIDAKLVEASLAEVDAAISAQVDEVLHHPEVRRLETAWRGVKFLVDRTDFREPIRAEVVSTAAGSLLETFDEVVYGPDSRSSSPDKVSLVVVDRLFDRVAADVAVLRGLAERAAVLSAPVLAGAGPSFLGLSSMGELAAKTGLAAAFGGAESTDWRAFRDAGSSRWLGLVTNGFLLRARYAPGELDDREFGYREGPSAPDDDAMLWGDPVWAVAALATRSFARLGWCTEVMGQGPAARLEALPTRTLTRPGSVEASFPLQTVVPDGAERDLAENGIMVLTAPVNSDRAHLRFAPTAHRPEPYPEPLDRANARLQSTLPFQMFVSRVLSYCMVLEPILVPGRSHEKVAEDYASALRGLLATTGAAAPDAVKVTVAPPEEGSATHALRVSVRWPGSGALPGAGEVEFSWPLES